MDLILQQWAVVLVLQMSLRVCRVALVLQEGIGQWAEQACRLSVRQVVMQVERQQVMTIFAEVVEWQSGWNISSVSHAKDGEIHLELEFRSLSEWKLPLQLRKYLVDPSVSLSTSKLSLIQQT